MVYVIYKYINTVKTTAGYFTKEEKAIEHCLTENEKIPSSPLNRKEFIDPATGQKKYIYPGETYSTPMKNLLLTNSTIFYEPVESLESTPNCTYHY